MNEKNLLHIAVVASPVHRLAQLLNLSRTIAEKYNCKFSFFFDTPSQDSIKKTLSSGHDTYVRVEKLGFVKVDDPKGAPAQASPFVAKLKKAVRLVFENRFFGGFLAKYDLNHLNKEYGSVLDILKNTKIKSIMVCGDRHLGIEPLFLKAAQELKMQAVVPYMSIAADQKSALILRKESFWLTRKFVGRTQWRKISALNPKLTSNNYLYYQPSKIQALSQFGVLSENPWQMGSGKSSVVCVDSDATKKAYVENGVSPIKLKVVGDTSFDSLFEKLADKGNLRSKIFEKYHLKSDKKTVVLALPQLGEHGLITWDQHWTSIHQLLESLSVYNLNFLISLHPKMDPSKYLFIPTKYGYSIVEEQLQDVLPVGDVFLAGFSSTVFWATLCGLPSIVMDYFEFNYDIFNGFTSISIVLNKEQLCERLSEILHHGVDFKNDWRLLSRDLVFDGCVVKRYYQLLSGDLL